jgi:hypothetical protein
MRHPALLGLPTAGKRTEAGRRSIHAAALQPLVTGLDHPPATEHELDGEHRRSGGPAAGLVRPRARYPP